MDIVDNRQPCELGVAGGIYIQRTIAEKALDDQWSIILALESGRHKIPLRHIEKPAVELRWIIRNSFALCI